MDLINPDKLCVNLFKGFDITGCQSFHFSHRQLTSPLLRYGAACDAYVWLLIKLKIMEFVTSGSVLSYRPIR